MIIKKLLVPFINEKILHNAEHCYIATAGLSEPALDFLMGKLPPKCKVDLLLGLDLPTSPEVLMKVLKQYPTRIHLRIHTKSVFHSNAYIFDLPFRKMVAFVGSGSLTMGGIRDHEELSYKIETEKGVEEVKSWFRTTFELAEGLSDRAISLYQDVYPSLIEREVESKREKKEVLEAMAGSFRWNSANLTAQYFQEEDYKTFESHKMSLHTQLVQFERDRVQTKLMGLHEQLMPFLKTLKLHPHPFQAVSSPDPLSHLEHKVKGMWLAYGIGEKERKENDSQFEDRVTIRIIIKRHEVGVWLLPCQANKGGKDLSFFRDEMQKEDYRKKLFALLQALGEGYWMDIAGEKRPLSFFKSADHLLECLVQESIDFYFILGKTFIPHHPDLLSAKMPSTMQGEITKLYSIYKEVKEK